MTPERWKKIEDIFQEALDLTGEARENFIKSGCNGDEELRLEVEKLVARFEAEEEFLESPVWTDSAVFGNTLKSRVASSLENEILPDSSDKSFKGKKIGVYRLTEQIGKGGMGVVYAAERADGEFYQKVAIKLIKRGMDTDFIVRRFRHERQILANLNHPNIARLLDGGTTDDALPFFVMEFIEGEPFLKYCERQKLDLRQKLELFLEVCAPVIYAHKRKIIHRDIKPSNILVTEEGIPKLLDFGIAKLLDTDSVHESYLPTATAMRLMTPEYASPEQVRGEEITTSSDQYSLGVLLYELVTGERPYKFPSRSPHEIARVICEEMPSEPSSGDFGKEFREQDIDLKLDKDDCKKLDRIVLKTLRKISSERYASVEDFADDIRLFLNNKEIRAESLSNVLEKGKFVTGKVQSESNENGLIAPLTDHTFSPRRKGIKKGVFLIVLSFILLPVFFLLTLAGGFHPAVFLLAFLLCFLSGIARIIYALLLESKTSAVLLPGENANQIGDAETILINSSVPRETIAGKLTTAKKTVEEEKSIAVLPFKNLNAFTGETTGGSEFLSIGLADALITRISNVRQFVVRPTSSVLRFDTGETDALEIGRELNVKFVVTGNVVKSENRIRVSVQLLDIENRSTVWAKKFDEDFTDYLDLEDSISEKVVGSLLPRLTGAEREQLKKRGTENAGAYEAYMRGRFYWNSFTEDSFARAFEAYNEAIEKDENYALAYAGIADYYIWLGVYGVVAPKECYPRAKEAAEKAISIDTDLAEAYAALGFVQLCGDFDWKNAEKNCLRAIELNPHYALARLWYSYVLQSAGRFDEGIEQAKEAARLDPLTYTNHHVLAWAYYFARRFNEAIAQAEKTIKKFPAVGLGQFSISWYQRFLGKTDDALDASRNALELSGESLFVQIGHAQALAAAGKKAEAEAALQMIVEMGESHYISFYQIALVYVYLNEKENALDALERAFADREGWLIWLKTEPALDPLRGEKRFQNLLAKLDYSFAPEKYPPVTEGGSKFSVAAETGLKQPKSKSGLRTAVKYSFFALLALFFGFAVYNIATHTTFTLSDMPPGERWKTGFNSIMSIRRLTTSGEVKKAVVSPDGKQILYVSSDDQTQSLRIRDIEAETERELVAPSGVFYLEVKFSPDGKQVYYLLDRSAAPRTLFRIPLEGGDSEKLSEEIFYSFTLSPDGRRIAYDYSNRETKKYNIRTAEITENSSLQNPQFVTEITFPDYYIGVLSFSPDGKKLMYGVSKIEESKEAMNLYTYDFETKTETQLTKKNFSDIAGGAWRKGGEEIVVCATEDNSSLYQLWLVSFPSGDVTRLSNDFYDYYGVSLTEDSSALVTIKKDSTANLWLGGTIESNRNSDTSVTQITDKTSRRDGIEGLSWTNDGRIVFVSSVSGETNISIVNADGTDEKLIPVKTTNPAHPVMTSDNRHLVFADQKEQKMSIWRFDFESNEPVEISSRYAVTPALAPDDWFVYYSTFSRTNGRMTIHRKPLLGGEETEIISQLTVNPVVSPDGKHIACFTIGKHTENIYQIAVFPVENKTGEPLKIIKVFQSGNLDNPQSRPLAWSPDGKFLYFVNHIKNSSNIFRVAVEGEQKTEQVTNFTSGKIFDFALAGNGKRYVISRGTTSSDIVIFKKNQNDNQ